MRGDGGKGGGWCALGIRYVCINIVTKQAPHTPKKIHQNLYAAAFSVSQWVTRDVCARYVVACAGQENMAAMIGNKEANERCRGRGDDSFGIFLLSS